MPKPKSMAEIETTATERFSTGYPVLDHIIGSTRYYRPDRSIEREEFGLGRGKVVILGGEEGVGKTKWYTTVFLAQLEQFQRKVLCFQIEMQPEEYKQDVLRMCGAMGIKPHLENLFVFHETSVDRQAEIIREIQPDLVVVDSVSIMDGYTSKKGTNHIVFTLKEAIGTRSACILIAHLNERGQITSKHIRFMVDGYYTMAWARVPEPGETEEEVLGRFMMRSWKNRSGPSGLKAFIWHRGDALEIQDLASWLKPKVVPNKAVSSSVARGSQSRMRDGRIIPIGVPLD